MFFGCSRGKFPVERGIGFEELFYVLYEKLGIKDYDYYENDVFVLRPYYWGECDCDANDGEYHKKNCSLIQPNFHHKPSDLRIKWYKRPFRDSYSNQEMTLISFFKVIHSCLQSIQGGSEMQIETIEYKETQSGKEMARVQLVGDKKWYTVWPDYETGEWPEGFEEGAYIEAQKAKKGSFWNLTNLVVVDEESEPEPRQRSSGKRSSPNKGQSAPKRDHTPDSMLLSYAKDLAVSIGCQDMSEDEVLGRVRRLFEGLKKVIDKDVPF